MLEPLRDHYAPAAAAPASAIDEERETLALFAPNDALEKLLPAHSARRFAALRSSLREAQARSGPRRTEPQHGSLGPLAAPLREATKYYERHVLAWYALGRVAEAQAAREAIMHHQLTLTAEPAHNGSRPLDFEAFGQTRLPILTTLGVDVAEPVVGRVHHITAR
jgi:hypothetical protein